MISTNRSIVITQISVFKISFNSTCVLLFIHINVQYSLVSKVKLLLLLSYVPGVLAYRIVLYGYAKFRFITSPWINDASFNKWWRNICMFPFCFCFCYGDRKVPSFRFILLSIRSYVRAHTIMRICHCIWQTMMAKIGKGIVWLFLVIIYTRRLFLIPKSSEWTKTKIMKKFSFIMKKSQTSWKNFILLWPKRKF